MREMVVRRTVVALLALAVGACSGSRTEDSEMADEAEMAAAAAPSLPDTTGAAVWSYLQEVDYRSNWELWPDKGELYTGQEPHGMLLTTYVNETANNAVMNHSGSLPAGAIVVKENYMPDSTLAAVTVMYKVEGFDAEHNDWFFSKHLPGGELDTMPNGMAMEGHVPGCQNCHGGVADNDYIFTSSLTGEMEDEM